MPVSNWTEADTVRAEQFWEEYQREHDLSDRHGQVVGIDPDSGRIWFDSSGKDVAAQLAAEGVCTLVFLARVGSRTYLRKAGRW